MQDSGCQPSAAAFQHCRRRAKAATWRHLRHDPASPSALLLNESVLRLCCLSARSQGHNAFLTFRCALQAIALGKRPHIVVGTPGRVVDHLSNTKASVALYRFPSCPEGRRTSEVSET